MRENLINSLTLIYVYNYSNIITINPIKKKKCKISRSTSKSPKSEFKCYLADCISLRRFSLISHLKNSRTNLSIDRSRSRCISEICDKNNKHSEMYIFFRGS